MLKAGVQELKNLMHDLLRKEAKGACISCGGDSNERLRLEVQLHKATEAREKGERKLKSMEDEAKKKDEEILELKSKVFNQRTFVLWLFSLIFHLDAIAVCG